LRNLIAGSFVDTAHFLGTCYRAADWIRVAQTQGRGRQDRFKRYQESIKDIYVYPLEKDVRARLGLAVGSGLGHLWVQPKEWTTENWVKQEFGGAPLRGARSKERPVAIVVLAAEK
jgi:hypothetical protein